MLGHLSEQNNHPEIVRLVATQALESAELGARGWPLPRSTRPSEVFAVLRRFMIPRYTRPEMGRIWSDQNKFQQWLEVELAASEALAELGVVPAEAARLLRAHAGFDVARILEIEEEVKHDVIAFTTAVAETMAARRPRRGLALAALRADLQRRGGYRAGAAAAAGRRPSCCAVWRRCARC